MQVTVFNLKSWMFYLNYWVEKKKKKMNNKLRVIWGILDCQREKKIEDNREARCPCHQDTKIILIFQVKKIKNNTCIGKTFIM